MRLPAVCRHVTRGRGFTPKGNTDPGSCTRSERETASVGIFHGRIVGRSPRSLVWFSGQARGAFHHAHTARRAPAVKRGSIESTPDTSGLHAVGPRAGAAQRPRPSGQVRRLTVRQGEGKAPNKYSSQALKRLDG